MTYIILQTTLMALFAIFTGIVIGWWIHRYFHQEALRKAHGELEQLKEYFAESVKENSRLKLQLSIEEKKAKANLQINGVDFESYQTFEKTIKAANMRRFLN